MTVPFLFLNPTAEIAATETPELLLEQYDAQRSIESAKVAVRLGGRVLDDTARGVREPPERRRIGLVPQQLDLFPNLSVRDNVGFPLRARGVARSAARATADELLRRFELGDRSRAKPAELSGGEAQRVAIARALAQRPQLLLCDEPTGHLDSDTGERVLELLEALQREFGFALVVATHDADVAARLGRAVQLHDGRVLAAEVAA